MSLFLIETTTTPETADGLRASLTEAAAGTGGSLVEARATAARDRVFVVVEHGDIAVLGAAVASVAPGADVAEVRLVGATVDAVRADPGANYLAEWDLPEGLTMETYLARKAAKSPLYAQVPEVRFERTYVREDMDKCLCFYQAECEEDVLLARKVVETPVDRLNELDR